MRDHYDFNDGDRGAAIATPGQRRVTLLLDVDVIEAFQKRAEDQGLGYQTLINATLREAIVKSR